MSKEKKEMKTVAEVGDWKGSPVLSIWEVNENGEREKFPVVSFGKKKSKAILQCLEDIRKFAE